ncbi:MAG: SIR2 family protein [Thermodesulfobacteriota bacterium]
MKIEDIIFLGAGASACEGAPLQGDLFREYFRSCQIERDDRLNNEMDQRLVEFFEIFFGIDIKSGVLDNVSFPTFEEILGMLELALNREESFKDYNLTPDKPRIQRIREDLIFLIAIILDKKLRGKAKYHKKLINRLKIKLSKTVFVSLNYDILIDNALVDLHPSYDLDYGVEFTNFEKPSDWKRPRTQKAVCLYKLHGSLNWLYCPTCISLTLTPKEKRVATLVFNPQICDVCGSEMAPIIIPPTFFKVMSNFYLQEIWRKAENALKQVKRIFFCGYSFPDADIHIKYLLKRVEINSGSTPEIFIINNHEGISDYQRESEELRYKRFFKNSYKVHYTDQSFENFCEQGV